MSDKTHPDDYSDDPADNPSENSTESMRYLTIMIEQVLDQNRAVLEAVADMQASVAHIPLIEVKVDMLSEDMKTVKADVRATNTAGHEKRLGRLETTIYITA